MKRQFFVDTGQSIPSLYVTAEQLSKMEKKTSTTYRRIIHEIEKEIKRGRYPETAVGMGKPMDVSYYVYRDYITYKNRLKNRNTRKTVPPFNPAEIAALCPIVKEVVVVGGEGE